MTDTEALRQIIKKKGVKLNYLAEKLGLSPYGLSLKIENKNEFKTGEVAMLCDLLDITTLGTKERIFFAKKDDLKSTKA